MSASRWSAYRPSPNAPWDLGRAWTLRRRAGFAATWDELQRDLESGPEAAVDRVLNGTGRIQGKIAEFATTADLLGDAAASGGDIHRLQAWWLYPDALHARSPNRTPDALIWHNHFATSQLKVDDVGRRCVVKTRPFAATPAGRSATCCGRCSTTRPFSYWLDAPSNRKGKPNENLARELMELFTLGVGQFSERDVKEVARALTGRTVVRGRYVVRSDWHDEAPKTILGENDRFDSDKVADLLLQHPATARRLAWRLCHTFLGESVADEFAVSELAERLRNDGLHVGRAVEVDPPLGALLLRAEPVHTGLGAGPLRGRHGAEPRAIRPAAEHALARRLDRPPGPGAVLTTERRRLAGRSKLAVGRWSSRRATTRRRWSVAA